MDYNIFKSVLDSAHIKSLRHDLGDDVAAEYAKAVVMLYRNCRYVCKNQTVKYTKLKDIVEELIGAVDLKISYDDRQNTVFYLE